MLHMRSSMAAKASCVHFQLMCSVAYAQPQGNLAMQASPSRKMKLIMQCLRAHFNGCKGTKKSKDLLCCLEECDTWEEVLKGIHAAQGTNTSKLSGSVNPHDAAFHVMCGSKVAAK